MWHVARGIKKKKTPGLVLITRCNQCQEEPCNKRLTVTSVIKPSTDGRGSRRELSLVCRKMQSIMLENLISPKRDENSFKILKTQQKKNTIISVYISFSM